MSKIVAFFKYIDAKICLALVKRDMKRCEKLESHLSSLQLTQATISWMTNSNRLMLTYERRVLEDKLAFFKHQMGSKHVKRKNTTEVNLQQH